MAEFEQEINHFASIRFDQAQEEIRKALAQIERLEFPNFRLNATIVIQAMSGDTVIAMTTYAKDGVTAETLRAVANTVERAGEQSKEKETVQ